MRPFCFFPILFIPQQKIAGGSTCGVGLYVGRSEPFASLLLAVVVATRTAAEDLERALGRKRHIAHASPPAHLDRDEHLVRLLVACLGASLALAGHQEREALARLAVSDLPAGSAVEPFQRPRWPDIKGTMLPFESVVSASELFCCRAKSIELHIAHCTM
ncbi:hypothetical protein TW95_gp0081 [Pandoravirus inopinatum]|uniref:Uncharacterized protein n=1 Tax=Pandoravirus inopinatum TaxID=1605721 RepID=A0A0B5J5A3_9VIRU|nr:hypothetical protein TW95_gp0081 [Pandoravirus inopinatum]AJF96815.1 hypothetical protein [Pandoravirus inopinatum]